MERTINVSHSTEELIAFNRRKIFYKDLIAICLEFNDGMELDKLLNEDGYLRESYIEQRDNVQDFLHQINDAFLQIEKDFGINRAELFVPKFIEFLVNQFALKDSILTTDTMHSALAYKEENKFYLSILTYLTDKDYLLESVIDTEEEDYFLTQFQSNLASIYRRQGNLDNASRLLESCEERMELNNNNQPEYLRQLSLIEYELAYIYNLKGEGEKAYDFFGQSAEHAIEAHHEIGEWVSKCVQKRVGYIYDIIDISEYESTVLEALEKFESLTENNPFAQRWVVNSLLNLIRVSFYKRDLEGLEKNYAEIQNSKWIQNYNYNTSVAFQSMLPRLQTIRENWEEALSIYNRFLPKDQNELADRMANLEGKAIYYTFFEGLAEHFLDLGNLYLELGQTNNAINTLKLGLEVPEYGNVPFQTKIREKLKEL